MRIFIVLFSLFWGTQIIDANVITCGGFVKTLNGAKRTGIKVRLLTMEGNQKYETECNPDNGYYVIPVYNKGQYKFQIVPPSGWIYEKDTFTLNVDGKNDECTKGIDINFEQTGYTISGLVKSGNLDGPSGFKLGLFLNDKLVSEVTTDENGKYSFAAIPGKYVVYNVDKEAQCIERGKVSVSVVDAPIVVKPDITISGHLLTVNVLDENRQPYPGVKVSLRSRKKLFENRLNQDYIVETPVDGGYQYYSQADKAGRVEFPCLPPGDYSLTSLFKTKDVELIFTPKNLELSMKSQNTIVEFIAAGFVATGQVLIDGNPIGGADILLDGVKLTKTDANGKYLLKEVKSGQHRLTAEKENYLFDVQNVKLSPVSPSLPNIVVNKINICGVVKLDTKDFASARILMTGNNGQFSADVDNDGFFCLAVSPAKYVVRAEGVPPVTPESYNVDVTKAPVLNLLFTQFKANVQSSVQCLGSCDNYYVTLSGDDGIVAKENAAANVIFKDVPPGRYNLIINANQQTCWNHDKIEFRVEDKDITDLIFRQIGYKINVVSNFPMKLEYQHLDKDITSIATIEDDSKSFCVPASGVYKLTPKSCHEYLPSQISYNVPSSEPVEIYPKKAHVTIKINAPSISENFTSLLRIKDDSDQVISETSLTSSGNTFSVFLDMENVDKTVEFFPQSKTYLFTPETLSFVFDGNCNENQLIFNAEKGLFIQGSIVPPVPDAIITVSNQKNQEIQNKFTIIDAKGKFSVGPLSPNFQYEVTIEKEGYKFIKNSGNNFQAVKLSELRISFVDVETKAPLDQVLTSISGADSYRSNQIVGETGSYNYIGLPPGEYYIVAVLQEYQFDKVPAKITIKEGKVESLVLEGKRTAWSAFGKITYLNGRPVSQIHVEALSKKCGNLQEDATTDQNGQYRIRGLVVDCEYKITPKLSNDEYSLYPPYIKNIIKREDRKGVDFVITTLKQTFELFGKLNFGENDYQPSSLRASLKYKNNVVQVTDIIAPSRFFIFVNDTVNSGDKFVVLIEDVKTRRIVEVEESVVADGPFAKIEFNIRSKKKSSDIVVSNNSYFGIILISVIALIFLYPEKARPIVNHGFSLFQNIKAQVLERNGQFVEGNRRTRRS